MRQGSRPRGLLGTRGRAGLASTVGPVLVGVILAFAWNMAGSHGTQLPQPGPGLAPTVGTAVDQAADQAWASATPITTRFPDHRAPAPAGSAGPARTGCHQARSSGMVRAAPAVGPTAMSACSSSRRFPEVRKTASAMSASTTALPVYRRSGHSRTLVVAVPARGDRGQGSRDVYGRSVLVVLAKSWPRLGSGIIPVGRRSATADVSSLVRPTSAVEPLAVGGSTLSG